MFFFFIFVKFLVVLFIKHNSSLASDLWYVIFSDVLLGKIYFYIKLDNILLHYLSFSSYLSTIFKPGMSSDSVFSVSYAFNVDSKII